MTGSEVEKIKQLLEQWCKSTRYDEKDNILSQHLADAIIFDVLPPLQYTSTQEYRQSFDAWQPPFAIPSLFELDELVIHADSRVGFAHCLIHCGGDLPDGKTVRSTVRATFCFTKVNEAWCVAHHHISMPMSMKDE
ncbi:nuclear transport factor 2 family protein [Aestuariibacter sp. AA17]|uniref:Nuclear transport factor 2 family protein n=1 Tax=Fluctibacter corallii TaxID=2984329 RepID=A0ABT3ABL7_9ALTE|nr:nuclear transport factor 2 family protein [Aestuariibacter sp. AA17]MCV2886060.1 nuclear transport factor 2 family protein [Aestuariibacter sp. AA17]